MAALEPLASAFLLDMSGEGDGISPLNLPSGEVSAAWLFLRREHADKK